MRYSARSGVRGRPIGLRQTAPEADAASRHPIRSRLGIAEPAGIRLPADRTPAQVRAGQASRLRSEASQSPRLTLTPNRFRLRLRWAWGSVVSCPSRVRVVRSVLWGVGASDNELLCHLCSLDARRLWHIDAV